MPEKMGATLLPKRLYRSPTQVIRVDQMEGMNIPFRLHLPEGVAVFTLASISANKERVKIKIASVKGDVDLSVGEVDLDVAYLGIAPQKAAGQEEWFPHWTEPAIEFFPAGPNSEWKVWANGVIEIFSDGIVNADIRSFSLNPSKVIYDNARMWAPEFGKWYPLPQATGELTFTEVTYYPDGRLLGRAEGFWAMLNQKKG